MTATIKKQNRNGVTSTYFRKEIMFLKILGVSLEGNTNTAYKIYSFLLVGATVFMYPILDFFELFKHDFSVVTDILTYEISGLLAIAKTIVLLKNRVKILKLLVKLEQKPFLPNPERGGDQEQKLITTCLWITTVQTATYWILGYSSVACIIVYTLYKRITSNDYHDWLFAYGPFTVLNVSYSPNYEICWFYQNFSIIWFGGIFSCTDLLLAGVLVHLKFQFKMLQNNVQRLVEISYNKMMKDKNGARTVTSAEPNYEIDGATIPWKYLRISLKEAVKYHLAILEVAEETEEVFSNLLLMIFLGTLGMVCCSVYNASVTSEITQLVRTLGEGIACILQVFFSCYWGEEVTHEGEKVGWAAYNSNFVGTDLRFQKGLALIIRRSQNPTRLTAGKFADVGLSTFAWIQRTSYSSFMILRRSKTKEV